MNKTASILRSSLLAVALGGFFSSAQAVGGLADIQVYDRAQNRTLPVHWHEGRAYVVGNPGNEYQVHVANRAGGEVLAVVSVDGVNVVTGETASPGQSGYVLGRFQRYDIKGWRKSLDRTAAFYFTQLPDSYAARTGRPDHVGVIGVAVFRRKPAVLQPPPAVSRDERPEPNPVASPRRQAGAAADMASQASGAAAEMQESLARSLVAPAPEKSLGTGHGRSEISVVRNVEFERATQTPAETITIYYDSRANLMARGIIPAAPVAMPQPFPGRFVPDPPRS